MLFNPENFESGSAPWSLTSVGSAWGGGLVAIDTSSKVYEANSLKFNATAAGSAYAQKVLASDTDEIYVQFKIFVPTAFSFGSATAGSIFVLRDNADSDIIALSIADYGSVQLVLNNFTGIGYIDALPALTKNVEYTIELHFKRAASGGRIRLWVDKNNVNAPDYDSGAVNTGSTSFRKLTYGLGYTDGNIGAFYEDMLCADTTFIGSKSIADFIWKGFGWFKRADPGLPSYNEQWDAANVVGPDVNDYITLKITNPSGTSPYAAEIFTVDPGGGQFGYGKYKIVVGSRLDILPDGAVFGSLFTFEDQTPTGDVSVTNNEIDVSETSSWGEGGPVRVSHNYFRNVGGVKTGDEQTYNATADPVTTHVMTWEPGKITWDSYVGESTFPGARLKHREVTTNVPVPTGQEFLDINLWIVWGSVNNAPTIAPCEVIVRDMSYEPYVPPGPPIPVTPGDQNFFFES